MACRCPWTALDSNIEVFGDAHFAGCISTRKSTVGEVALWSGQFVKAWSRTMGILALSCGESELAAVAIKSDATAAIGMVHRLGLGKVSTFGCWKSMVQHHVRSGKIRVSKMSGLENLSDAQSTLGQNHCCATRKRVIGYLSMEGKAYFADGDKM